MENKNIIICIGRQLGSGGHDIGRMLAAEFDAKYYDRELLNLAAKESGFSKKVFERNDEQKGFFKTLFGIQTTHIGGGLYNSNISQDSLFQFQSDAIRKAAAEGNCVFVGRCADYVLRDIPNVVKIFITATMYDRITRISASKRATKIFQKKNITPKEAKHCILQAEGHRASYYNYYTGKKWGAAESYDLCISSSVLGLEGTVQFIADFIRKRYGI
ncbi:MAG: cytidylate kinase-like family protein [Prevotella sp.]|nr:cytidylate kinase-like family protein [Prevotella sp.]